MHENNIGFANSAQTKHLDNGWYIEVGDSQETLLLKGRRLLDSCGFRHCRCRWSWKMEPQRRPELLPAKG